MSIPGRMRSPWRSMLRGSNTTVPRDIIRGFASRALGILEPEERKKFMEEEIRRIFDFSRIEILVRPEGAERFASESTRVRGLLGRIAGILEGSQAAFLNGAVASVLGASAVLEAVSADYVFPIRHGKSTLGLLVVDSTPRRKLASELEHALVVLCDQVALVLENSSLLKSKMELQHTIAAQAQMVQIGEMTSRIAFSCRSSPHGSVARDLDSPSSGARSSISAAGSVSKAPPGMDAGRAS